MSWTDRVPERDGQKSTVWDLAFKPDGQQLVVAVGTRVLVYDAVDGDLLHSLKGHKDTVYCVAYSRDGKRFASGGADKTIIIWTSKAEGILKYSHNDSIQKLVYNPVSQALASVTASDFGLWSPEQKAVQKHKVPSKILSAAYTPDGQFLALGMLNGHITIRDKAGAEKVLIERTQPIWTLQWNPSRDEPFDVLAVGCWDQTLSFYQLSGIQHGKDKRLDFDPTCVSYFSNGSYIVVGGSDKKATLMTKEGIKLTTIGERDDWVWSCVARPKQNYVAVGCNDGTITMYQLVFSTVHGLYQDRYAYRDTMTDVIVQHLITEQRVRIKCRAYVKKIAVYRDRLAVQLPDLVTIYELANDDSLDMHYRVREKIHRNLECNLLVVTSLHVILCLERKLQLFDFSGNKEREWVLESVIRYIKVVGGPPGREGLLVGLKSGTVLKIFVDNPFPISLIQQRTSIRCLDLSASRRKLAVVDENAMCLVYDLNTKDLLFEEPNANSVAWNTEMEDMLCFSGSGMLSIKTGNFPIHQQKLQGFVVGFHGSKIFCLHYVAMQTIDVPQSASLYRYLDIKDWDMAYKVACLGVTESDWRLLAITTLRAMQLSFARKAFIRVRDMRYIDLINSIEQARRRGGGGDDRPGGDSVFLAEIMAYEGKYQEAAKLYAKAGETAKAIEMFRDLRLWEDARTFAESSGSMDVNDLIKHQAKWEEDMGNNKQAVNLYIASKQFDKAIDLCGERGWLAELMEVARSVPKEDKETLAKCAAHLRKHDAHKFAQEVYLKMGDIQGLMSLHIAAHHWDEAFELARAHEGRFDDDVFLPYAEYLAITDKFEEAQAAYKKAGRPDLSRKILQQLTHNAVVERRYMDAGYYFWLLSAEFQRILSEGAADASGAVFKAAGVTPRAAQQRWHEYQLKAELYHAYHYIYQYVDEPFTSMMPESLFNVARFLLNTLAAVGKDRVPYRVSRVYVLYTAAKQGSTLGAYKLARYAFDELQQLRLPPSWTDQIDLSMMTIQSKAFSDKEELLPVCYRCSTTNQLLNTTGTGDKCIDCGHMFVRSFASFDTLPLVQFFLEDGIADDEAVALLAEEPASGGGGGRGGGGHGGGKEEEDKWRETRMAGDVQTMTFGDESPSAEGGAGGAGASELSGDDMFNELLSAMESGTADGHGSPVVVGRRLLRALSSSEVFVQRWEGVPGQRARFYKSMIPDLGIAMCRSCQHFFHQEDFEFAVLQKGHCPFCRADAAEVGLG